MTTYLITSKNSQISQEHAISLATDKQIHTQDITIMESQGSIGIEDIRNFQKQIMLKPMRGENKAVIIKNAHTLTTEAQNALLKTLEEPPDHTYIYLTAETSSSILPTILSRTTIILLEEKSPFDEQLLEEIEKKVTDIFSFSVGNKLKLAETLALDKETTLAWLEKAMYSLRQSLLKQHTAAPKYIKSLEAFQKTYSTLKSTNVNARLTLEILFLSL